MKHVIRTMAFTLVLTATFLPPRAEADRQGGGTLITSGLVKVDKRLDFDARFIPLLDANIVLAHGGEESVVEYVRFKSVQSSLLTFEYTLVDSAKATAVQMTINRDQLSGDLDPLVAALSASKESKSWSRIKVPFGGENNAEQKY